MDTTDGIVLPQFLARTTSGRGGPDDGQDGSGPTPWDGDVGSVWG